MYWVYSISAYRHSCNIISTCSVGNIAINHGDLFHKVQDRGGRSGMSGFGSWSQAIGKPAVKSVGFLSPWKTGWWCNNHLEKYEFVSWERWHPIYDGKSKHVWNHQPEHVDCACSISTVAYGSAIDTADPTKIHSGYHLVMTKIAMENPPIFNR